MKNITSKWTVIVSGGRSARLAWPTRSYRSKASAMRRVKQIREVRDIGVETIWTIRE